MKRGTLIPINFNLNDGLMPNGISLRQKQRLNEIQRNEIISHMASEGGYVQESMLQRIVYSYLYPEYYGASILDMTMTRTGRGLRLISTLMQVEDFPSLFHSRRVLRHGLNYMRT